MKLLKNSTYQDLLNANSVLASRVAELEKERIKTGVVRDKKGRLRPMTCRDIANDISIP